LKEKILNNIGTKILSLFFAFVFWVIVINIDDPVRTRQFTNIPVTVTNEKAITKLDKVYEVIQGKTVDITVSGKKSLVDKITSQDLQATADLSQLSMVNAVNIYPECVRYPSLTCSLGRVQTLKVSLENMKTVRFVPVIQQVGTVADGYYVVGATSNPNIIEVTGAKSQVKKIAEVRLEVDASNAKKDQSAMAVPQVYDSNGQELDVESFKFSVNEAKVQLNVRRTKTIPVIVDIGTDTMPGYECSSLEYEPKKVIIAGRRKHLEEISELHISMDLSHWTSSGEESYEVANYLPEYITVSSANPTIGVQVELERWITKTVSFKGASVRLKGKSKRKTYKRLHKNKIYSVILRGKQSVLNELESDSLKPYVNVKNLRRGKHEPDIKFADIKSVNFMDTNLTLPIEIS